MSGNSKIPGQSGHAFLLLDGLRGVAAISVMLSHYIQNVSSGVINWIPNASRAVDFFFALSGFVIAYAYEKKLLSGESTGRFMTRRLIRLYPLYFLGLSVPVVALLAKHFIQSFDISYPALLGSYAFGLFFLPTPAALMPPYWGPFIWLNSVFPLNGPAWSLSLEMGVNFIYARLSRWLTNFRLKILIAMAAIGLGLGFWFLSNDTSWNWHGYIVGWAQVMWSFFAGVLLYRLHRQNNGQQFPWWVGLILTAILLAIFLSPIKSDIFAFVNCVIVLPLIVWMGARTKILQSAHGLYAWLGKTSYAVYILHGPMIAIFFFIATVLHIDFHARISLSALGFGAMVLIIATAADAIYDLPIRAWLTRKLLTPRWQPALQAAPSNVEGG